MTKEPGSSAEPGTGPLSTADKADTAGAAGDDEAAAGDGERGVTSAPGAGVLAALSVAWLAAMLWSARAAITSSGADAMAITSAAYALPGVISASLVSGAATSLTMVDLLARRGVRRGAVRFAAAMSTGLVTGLLAALAVTLSYGDGSAIMVLAGTVAAAATIGGFASGVRSTAVIGAVVAAGLAVFAVGFVLSYFQDPMLSLYGAGDSPLSQVTALQWFSRTASLAGGLAAGLVVFGYLRLATRRSPVPSGGGAPLRWPAYLIAGAGPGLLLLAAEVLTRTAGARLLSLAGGLSEADGLGQDLLSDSRVNQALYVIFLGAFIAIIAFGRTLRPKP